MQKEPAEKYKDLKRSLSACGRLAVAFSGGVDSTLLLYAAAEACGKENVLAVTAVDQGSPSREKKAPAAFCKEHGIRHVTITHDLFAVPGLSENPPDRCYLCKKGLFSEIIERAAAEGIEVVCEGTNADDLNDYRPGLRAIRELGVKSPLKEAGLTKSDIRAVSKELSLPTASAPSLACLASRFAYGERITEERLARVDAAEEFLVAKGFPQVRVRIQDDGKLARIEVLPEEIPALVASPLRGEICEKFTELGFTYVSCDLKGYRTGAMNETLDAATLEKGK